MPQAPDLIPLPRPSRQDRRRRRRHLRDRAAFLRFSSPDSPPPPPEIEASIRATFPIVDSRWAYTAHVWTAEEWARLPVKPCDARDAGRGVRIALRVG